MEKNEVNHALLAYRKIVNSDDTYAEMLLEALSKRPPSDHRSVQGKQEIIAALQELKGKRFDEALWPYLDDHSDDVQCAAIDDLADSSNEATQARLSRLLESERHSARVLRRAAFVVAQQKIPVSEQVKLAEVVREDFRIEKGLLVALHQK